MALLFVPTFTDSESPMHDVTGIRLCQIVFMFDLLFPRVLPKVCSRALQQFELISLSKTSRTFYYYLGDNFIRGIYTLAQTHILHTTKQSCF